MWARTNSHKEAQDEGQAQNAASHQPEFGTDSGDSSDHKAQSFQQREVYLGIPPCE